MGILQEVLLPGPEAIARMCEVHSRITVGKAGLAYTAAQWQGMLFSGVSQGFGGVTMLYIIMGNVHIGLQQGHQFHKQLAA
jgi:hypothetical protein